MLQWIGENIHNIRNGMGSREDYESILSEAGLPGLMQVLGLQQQQDLGSRQLDIQNAGQALQGQLGWGKQAVDRRGQDVQRDVSWQGLMGQQLNQQQIQKHQLNIEQMKELAAYQRAQEQNATSLQQAAMIHGQSKIPPYHPDEIAITSLAQRLQKELKLPPDEARAQASMQLARRWQEGFRPQRTGQPPVGVVVGAPPSRPVDPAVRALQDKNLQDWNALKEFWENQRGFFVTKALVNKARQWLQGFPNE